MSRKKDPNLLFTFISIYYLYLYIYLYYLTIIFDIKTLFLCFCVVVLFISFCLRAGQLYKYVGQTNLHLQLRIDKHLGVSWNKKLIFTNLFTNSKHFNIKSTLLNLIITFSKFDSLSLLHLMF